jgi:hypothetical protein
MVMFSVPLVAGIIGYLLSEMKVIYLIPSLAKQIDVNKHSTYLAVGWSHVSSYLSGIIGTTVLCRIIYRRRKELQKSTLRNTTNFIRKEF